MDFDLNSFQSLGTFYVSLKFACVNTNVFLSLSKDLIKWKQETA